MGADFRTRAVRFVKENGHFDLKTVAESVDLVDIARKHVPTLRMNGAEWRGKCPFHADGKPSFVVVPKMQRFHCYGCMPDGEWCDVIDFVRKLKGCDYREAARYLVGDQVLEFCDADRERLRKETAAQRKVDDEKAEKNRRLALASWEAAKPIGGSPAEAYLRGRGIMSPLPAHSLRFVPDLFCNEAMTELPAMVAAIVDVRGSFLALHRTYLARGGDGVWRKAALEMAKRTLGRFAGGAIRLAPKAEVALKPGATLYVAEGIETALSVREALRGREDLRVNGAVWSGVSLGNMSRLGLPNEDGSEACLFGTVVLCVDRNESKADAHVAQASASALENYGARGVKVLIAEPMTGMDFNDMIQGQPRQAAE